MVTGPNSSPGWLNGGVKPTPSATPSAAGPTPSETPSATPTPSLTPSNAPARIGANTQGSVNSSAGSEAIENQYKATPKEELTSQQHLDRLAAAGQLMRKTYDQNKEMENDHEHQGVVGRIVENADNGLNYHNSYNNVHKRIADSEADANDLIWQTPEGGDKFNQGYNKVSGFNYDPNKPFIDDNATWGGEVADNAKSIKGYDKNQKAGKIAFGLFIMPGGYATGGTTSSAWEDNTRSDKTHDLTAKDYLKSLGFAAAGIAASFVPGVGAALNGVTKGITEGAGALASSIGNGAREGAGVASSAYNGFRSGLSNGWQSEMSNWSNAGNNIRNSFNTALNSTKNGFTSIRGAGNSNGGFFNNVGSNINSGLNSALSSARGGFNTALNSTKDGFSNISRPGWLNFGRGGGSYESPAGNVNFTSIRGAGNSNGGFFSNVGNNFRNTMGNIGDSLNNVSNSFKNSFSNISMPNFSRPSWLTSNGKPQSQLPVGYNATLANSSPEAIQGARAAWNNMPGRTQAPVSNDIRAQALELLHEEHPELFPPSPETTSGSAPKNLNFSWPNRSRPNIQGQTEEAPLHTSDASSVETLSPKPVRPIPLLNKNPEFLTPMPESQSSGATVFPWQSPKSGEFFRSSTPESFMESRTPSPVNGRSGDVVGNRGQATIVNPDNAPISRQGSIVGGERPSTSSAGNGITLDPLDEELRKELGLTKEEWNQATERIAAEDAAMEKDPQLKAELEAKNAKLEAQLEAELKGLTSILKQPGSIRMGPPEKGQFNLPEERPISRSSSTETVINGWTKSGESGSNPQ